jgi:L-iditol 2-dehydrogenase
LGPVGLLHVAVASSRGAMPVVGVDPIPGRVEAAAEVLGRSRTLLMKPGWEEAAREIVNGRGWDVIVLANVAPEAVDTAMSLVAPMGRIVAYAGLRADAPSVAIDWNAIHYRQIEVVGAFGGTPVYFQAAVRWLAGTDLELGKLVTGVFPLERALEAFRAVEKGIGLKTVLRLS